MDEALARIGSRPRSVENRGPVAVAACPGFLPYRSWRQRAHARASSARRQHQARPPRPPSRSCEPPLRADGPRRRYPGQWRRARRSGCHQIERRSDGRANPRAPASISSVALGPARWDAVRRCVAARRLPGRRLASMRECESSRYGAASLYVRASHPLRSKCSFIHPQRSSTVLHCSVGTSGIRGLLIVIVFTVTAPNMVSPEKRQVRTYLRLVSLPRQT